MKKHFLRHINVLLSVVSVALAGCHVQKKAAEQPVNNETDQPTIDEQVRPADEPVCIYGVLPEVYERPMLKYGSPDAAE